MRSPIPNPERVDPVTHPHPASVSRIPHPASRIPHWDAIVERLAPTYFFRDDSKTLVNEIPVYHENAYAAAGMYKKMREDE